MTNKYAEKVQSYKQLKKAGGRVLRNRSKPTLSKITIGKDIEIKPMVFFLSKAEKHSTNLHRRKTKINQLSSQVKMLVKEPKEKNKKPKESKRKKKANMKTNINELGRRIGE